jgi:hypothetical protein
VESIKPIVNSKNIHIGDSILKDGFLERVVFSDTTLLLDSIVYTRFNNNERTLKAVNSFRNGKKTLENIEYYENGNLKAYRFIDSESPNCFYERLYDEAGKRIATNGKAFFQGNVNEIDADSLSVKVGTTISIKIFYPNPPDSKTFLYVHFDEEGKKDVFHPAPSIPFLKTVKVDNNDYDPKVQWRSIDVGLEIKDTLNNQIDSVRQSLIYKVIK